MLIKALSSTYAYQSQFYFFIYFHKYLGKGDYSASVWCSSFWDRNHCSGTRSQFIPEAAYEWTCRSPLICCAVEPCFENCSLPFQNPCMWKLWLYDKNLELAVIPPYFCKDGWLPFLLDSCFFSLLTMNLPSDTFTVVWLATRSVVNSVSVGTFLPLSNIVRDKLDAFLAPWAAG